MKRFILKCASALLAVMLLMSPACVSEGATEVVEAELPMEEASPEVEAIAPQPELTPDVTEGLDLPSEDAPEAAENAPETAEAPDIPPEEPDTLQDDATNQDDTAPQDDSIMQDDAVPQEDPAPAAEEAPIAEAPAPAEVVDRVAEPDLATEEAPTLESAPSLEPVEPVVPVEPNAPVEPAEPPLLAEAGGIPERLVLGRREQFQLSGGDAYVSSRPKVASVDAAGLVRAGKKGKAVITVTAGGAVVGTCAVTVKAAPKKITLPKKRTVMLGQTLLLTPKLKGGASHTITWASSNPAVAAVDASGVVTGVGVGKAKITARTYNRKKAVCTVTVNSPDAPTRVSFPMSTLYVGMGESVTLRPALNPGATAAFTYASKNKKVASVTREGGVVKGKKLNKSTKITVKTHNGKKASLTVTVLKAPTGLTINIPSATMNVADITELSVFLPVGTASQITWTSSNPGVVAVGDASPFTEGNGCTMTVAAISPGSTTVTASTYLGQTATCEIRVNGSASEENPENTLKLLFIGNSHTYYNALPLTVQYLANGAGYDCDVNRITNSGWTLTQHTEDPYVSTAILNDDYDYVILQEKVNPMDAKAFLTAARFLNGLIRQTRAVPVIFGCWSKETEPEKQAELNAANRQVAGDIGALLAPVGEVWWAHKNENPDDKMYAEDGIHASKAGSDFAAGIIWDTIYSHLRG